MKTGQIVCSIAGRDKNCFLAVVGEDNGFVLLCDGKKRPLSRPKRKNVKHITITAVCLTADSMSSNKALRRALNAYSAKVQLKEET